MGQARDEAGNIWETDAQGNAVRLVQPAGGARGGIYAAPQTPQQAEDRDYKRRDQQLQEEAAALARRKAGLDVQEADAKRTTMEARGGVDSTESERTAAFLATRLAGGIQDLGRIGDIGAPSLKDALVGGTLLGNYSTDADRQRAMNAQRDILDAALTLGTGAAYTKEQIESYRASYFPQPGDAPDTIKDKNVRLQRLLEASRLKAGASASMIDDALGASIKAAPVPKPTATEYAADMTPDGLSIYPVGGDSPPADPGGGYQNSYLGQGMSGANEGLASTLGAPVDLMAMGMNLGSKGINALTNANIPKIERPFLGSEMIADNMKGWGVFDKTDDSGKQFARRVGQSVGASAVPIGAAPTSLTKAAQALGIAGVGGAGAAAAQQAFPNNPAAEFAGEVLGSGLSAATLAKANRLAATKRALEQVPSRDELRDQASNLYNLAESRGIVAGPNVTGNLAGRFSQIADDEKLRWPNGKVDPNYPRAGAALDMMDAHKGQNIDPRQIQVLRDNLTDSVRGTQGKEQRISRQMLDAFDEETIPLAPELAEARNVASRYLQSDEINRARQLAEADAPKYSNGGIENALRTRFRALDRNMVKGSASFNPAAAEAVATVSRGDRYSNALRAVGKLAPTGIVSSSLSAGVPFAIGNAMGGPALGAAASTASLGIGSLARSAATKATERQALLADALARNGGGLNVGPLLSPEVEDLLKRMTAGQSAQYIPR